SISDESWPSHFTKLRLLEYLHYHRNHATSYGIGFINMDVIKLEFRKIGTSEDTQPLSAMRVLALLSTMQSADIVLPTTDGREIRLRRITEPTAEQKALLQQLGLSLPEWFELNRKCSVDSAIA